MVDKCRKCTKSNYVIEAGLMGMIPEWHTFALWCWGPGSKPGIETPILGPLLFRGDS